jgi:hypothetical protein
MSIAPRYTPASRAECPVESRQPRNTRQCESRGMIHCVRTPRIPPGLLAILLLVSIGIGLISPALPAAFADAGCYDGDSDDAAVAPERLSVLLDLAVCTNTAILPAVWTSATIEVPAALPAPLIVDQSPPPPLRSPPDA